MTALDPRIEAIRVKYGLSADDFWKIPQNGQWVCKHAALEVVAAKAHIVFDNPQIIEADTAGGIAVLSVRGVRYPERIDPETGKKWYDRGEQEEWSTGEASPKNNKNSYPWAMAEKRAKDRVILKLAGLHGLVYSDAEGDFAAPDAGPAVQSFTPISSFRAKQIFKTDVILSEIDTAKNAKRCDDLEELFATELSFLPPSWIKAFRDRLAQRRHELANPTTTPAQTANDALDRQYAETIG